MDEPSAPPFQNKPAIARRLETFLFQSRWLMAPFYLGLVAALAALLFVFCAEIWHQLSRIGSMTVEDAIMMALSLIDLSLAANLVLIVIFSGYENFVSKIDTGAGVTRPSWMGEIDFSGLKMKLVGSIVAISAIALLRAFMQMAEGEVIENRTLGWMIGMHLTFVVSGVLLALMDFIAGRVKKH
jgi:uncharacterized protein (TIGR00645 family)